MLPLREVYKLHVSTRKKITIGSVFLLGGMSVFLATFIGLLSLKMDKS